MLEITTKINKTVKKFNMLSVGDTVVIGVSGGADSMLLLNYFLSVKDEYSLSLIVANVEHGIRGAESVNDSRFVEEYCKNNNITFKCLKINAPLEAENAGLGLEEYCRDKRYEFFRSFNANKIATAHNLSDNVETVLFRLSRGTSIKGCCGIPAVRGNIIRPLINLTSDEIRNACKDNNIPYVVDSTNSDNKYSRNFVRNQIISDFKELNPSFESTFARFIESVNQDEEFIEHEANKCFDMSFKDNTLQLKHLTKFHPSIVKRAIIKFVSLYDLSLDDKHLNALYGLTIKAGRQQIKGNYFAISDKKRFRIALFEEKIDFDSIVVNKKITSREDFLNNCEQYQKEFAFYCDYDKINGELEIRERDEGDEITLANRNVTKSLKKLYNELKIPVEDRDDIPVICDEKGIIGIYGYCCDERVKIDNTTNSVMLLQILIGDK